MSAFYQVTVTCQRSPQTAVEIYVATCSLENVIMLNLNHRDYSKKNRPDFQNLKPAQVKNNNKKLSIQMCFILSALCAQVKCRSQVGGPEVTLDVGQSLAEWPIKHLKTSSCQNMTPIFRKLKKSWVQTNGHQWYRSIVQASEGSDILFHTSIKKHKMELLS